MPETATTPAMENKRKVLLSKCQFLPNAYPCSCCTTDIIIRCLPEDSAQSVLSALTLVILWREDEDNVELERVSPTTWNCNYMIEL